MTRGRTMFGVGPGALVSDAFMMGIDPARQRDMMDESLGVILRLLRGETVTHKSDWFSLFEARLQMTPFTRPHIEVAVASQVSPTGARAAGRHGVGLLSLGATSTGGFNALSSNWAIAEDMAKEHGTSVDRAAWRLVGPMHIAETKDQAVADVRFGLEKWLYYFREIANLPVAPVEAGRDPVEALEESGLTVIGTPDEAADKIQSLIDQSGGFGAFLFMAHNWAPWDRTKRSYELFARYVAPRFQGLNENRDSSMKWVGGHKGEFTGAAMAAVGARIAQHAQEKGLENIRPEIAAMMGLKKPEAAE
jgi:limonene 1,2-monooxygenase